MSNDQIIKKYEDYLLVQNLLFEEASLLDNWKLDEWLEMYTEDAGYFVPPTDLSDDAEPESSLFYIADDRNRMQERVIRLNKKTCHSEYPRSKVCHAVSNVRIISEEDDLVTVEAVFVVYRTKDYVTNTFMGKYTYQLRRTADGFKIFTKRCKIDLNGLRPNGRISVIL